MIGNILHHNTNIVANLPEKDFQFALHLVLLKDKDAQSMN